MVEQDRFNQTKSWQKTGIGRIFFERLREEGRGKIDGEDWVVEFEGACCCGRVFWGYHEKRGIDGLVLAFHEWRVGECEWKGNAEIDGVEHPLGFQVFSV